MRAPGRPLGALEWHAEAACFRCPVVLTWFNYTLSDEVQRYVVFGKRHKREPIVVEVSLQDELLQNGDPVFHF